MFRVQAGVRVGKAEPFADEKLAPILAMYRAHDFTEAVDKAEAPILFGGHDRGTGANPRYPLIEDLKQLLLQAYSSGDTSEVDRQLTVV